MKRFMALGLLCTALLFSLAAAAQDEPDVRPAPRGEVVTDEPEFNVEIDRLSEQVRDAVTAAMREMSRMVETTVEETEAVEELTQPVELVFAITGVAENMSVVTARDDFELSISRSKPIPTAESEGSRRVIRPAAGFVFQVSGDVRLAETGGSTYLVRFEGHTQYEVAGLEGQTDMAFEGDLPLELGKTVTIARENDQKVTLTIRPMETE